MKVEKGQAARASTKAAEAVTAGKAKVHPPTQAERDEAEAKAKAEADAKAEATKKPHKQSPHITER